MLLWLAVLQKLLNLPASSHKLILTPAHHILMSWVCHSAITDQYTRPSLVLCFCCVQVQEVPA